MDSNFYYFGYLTHSEFPEVAIGLICFAAAFFVICKSVILIKEWRLSNIAKSQDSLPEPKELSTSGSTPISQYKDIREKIEGYWRDEERKLQVHIYSWGGAYLVEIKNLGVPEFVRYFTFSSSISDEYRFFAEGEEELVFAYNEQFDMLFYANASSFMSRVSEDKINMEKSIREALDKSQREALLDSVIFENNE